MSLPTHEVECPHADPTVVRLVEVGTHDELMAKRGQYAELYGIQAAAYR